MGPTAPSIDVLQWRIYFSVGTEILSGVLTRPMSDVDDAVVIVAPDVRRGASAAGPEPDTEIVRALAQAGVTTFHVDHHAGAMAPGRKRRVPVPDTRDLHGAVGMLRSYGMRRFAVVGVRAATSDTLLAAPDVDGLMAVALVSPSPSFASMDEVGRRRGWRQRLARASAGTLTQFRRGDRGTVADAVSVGPFPPHVVAAVSRLRDAQVPLLFLCGPAGAQDGDLRAALAGSSGRLSGPGDRDDVAVLAVPVDTGESSQVGWGTLTSYLLEWLLPRVRVTS